MSKHLSDVGSLFFFLGGGSLFLSVQKMLPCKRKRRLDKVGILSC